MIYYNYLYSILCGCNSVGRATCANSFIITPQLQEIRDVLVPIQCTDIERAILAELYIKIIKTDASLNKRLLRIDPYNSYDTVQYHETTLSDNIDLNKIAKNIKNLGLSTIRYNDCIGYIIIGLEQLLKLCEDIYA